MENVMEKFAGLPPSGQILLLAETSEKLATERDAAMEKLNELSIERELDELYHRLEKTGQLPAQCRRAAQLGQQVGSHSGSGRAEHQRPGCHPLLREPVGRCRRHATARCLVPRCSEQRRCQWRAVWASCCRRTGGVLKSYQARM